MRRETKETMLVKVLSKLKDSWRLYTCGLAHYKKVPQKATEKKFEELVRIVSNELTNTAK